MSETKETPKPFVETITRTWQVVNGIPPRACRCGHDHFPRTAANYAPQWHICEGDCGCHALRPVESPTP